MYFQHAISEQDTLPPSAVAFRRYLATYQIEPLDVALRSGVRYLTVWRIRQGQPVHRQDEALVRQALVRMTGIPYIAPLLTRTATEETNATHKGIIRQAEKMEWKEQ
ncbi:MAG TPA: hypothetical protein VFQ36_20275 [Ktedonobacteraceae bacterium]|nr:hypothetical protein [Ktedonobacteraceae bacterium]